MEKFSRVTKTIVSLILVVLFVVAMPVSALADTIDLSYKECVGSDGNPIIYAESAFNKNGQLVCWKGNKFQSYYAGAQTDANRAYCIDPGVPFIKGEANNFDALWETYTAQVRHSINLALLYGFEGSAVKLKGTADEKYVATQLIVWELADGCRLDYENGSTCIDTKYYDAVCYNGANPIVAENYAIISKGLEMYETIPSFVSASEKRIPIVNLHWDSSKNMYSATVTDTNNVLSEFKHFEASDSGIKFAYDGNNLTITSRNALSDTVEVTSYKDIPEDPTGTSLIAYGGEGDYQDVVTGKAESDPINVYLRLETTESQLRIVKVDSVSNKPILLEGFGFKIKDNSNGTYVTDSEGNDIFYTDATGIAYIPVALEMGTYTVEEVVAVGGYKIATEGYEIEIEGSDSIQEVKFPNELEKGSITVNKIGNFLIDFEDGEESGYEVKRPIWSSDGNVSLTGATFTLYAYYDIVTPDGEVKYKAGDIIKDKNDDYLENISVNNAGVVEFTDLYYGTYKIVETTAPYGYVKGGSKIVTISADSTDTMNANTTIVNYPRRLMVTLDKNLESDDYGIVNVEEEMTKVLFGLYSSSPLMSKDPVTGEIKTIPMGTLLDVAYANKDGNIYFTDVYLGIGRYCVKELQTSKYYKLDDTEYEFIIDEEVASDGSESSMFKTVWTGDNKEDFENYLSKGNASIKKVSEEGLPLAGAVIELYYGDDKLIGTYTSGSDGYFFKGLELLAGTYTFKEVSAPEGYILDETVHTMEVKDNESNPTVEMECVNNPIKGSVEVLKTGELFTSVTENVDENGTKTYIPNWVEGKLEGATFGIFADGDIITPDGYLRYSDGDCVAEVTTGEDGKAVFDDLYLGNYIVRETEAPDGYEIIVEDIKVTLKSDFTYVTTDEISNKRSKVSISLDKALEEDAYGLVDTKEEIKKVSFGLFAGEEIEGADGSAIPEDGMLEVKFCDENGNINFSADLPNGDYYVQELTTSEYYILDNTKYEFTVDNTEELTLDLSKGNDFTNKLKTGKISFKKVSAVSGKPLAGAKIEIKAKNGTEIYVGTTDNRGNLKDLPTNLPIGVYTYQEIEAPKGCKLDTTVRTFEITGNEADGEVVELLLENEYVLGKITVTKHGDTFYSVEEGTINDADVKQPVYGSVVLEGAEFTIYAVDDIAYPDGTLFANAGDAVEKIVTDKDGNAFSKELPLGTYIVKESKAPAGYALSTEEYIITISEGSTESLNGFADFFDDRNDVTVKLSKTMEVDSLKNVDAKAEIKKVAFGLYANEDLKAADGSVIEKGALIEKQFCDKNGLITFTTSLPNGNYYVQEMVTSDYYNLDTEKYLFTVDNTKGTKVIDLTKDYNFFNDLYKQELSFKKVASDTNQPLMGAEIEISTSNGEVIYTGITVEDGYLMNVPKLTIGKYSYREITAPKGYLLDTKVYEFEVTGKEPNGSVLELVMENIPMKGNITVLKVGDRFTSVEELKDDNGVTSYVPIYASGNLKGATFDIIAKEDIVTGDGTVQVKKGTVVDTVVTDENGIATSKDLYLGTYIVKETKAPDGYKVLVDEVEVTLSDTNTIVATDPINNDRNKTSVTLSKSMEVDKNGILDVTEEVQKVSFGVFANEDIKADDGKIIPKDGMIESKYCNADGKIEFSIMLPKGNYYVKELTTSEYYLLDDSKHEFTVSNNVDTVIDLSKDKVFENKLITKKFSIKKVSAESGMPIEGAEISVLTMDDKVLYTGTSNKDGIFEGLPQLPKGTYKYYETKAPNGCKLDKNVYTFSISGLEKDDEVIELVLENEYYKGKVSVTKYGEVLSTVKKNTDGGKTTYTPVYAEDTLKDAEFTIYADGDIVLPDNTLWKANGEVVAVITTNNKGIATADDLYLGNYVLKETKAPLGYELSDEVVPFTIKDGKDNTLNVNVDFYDSRNKVFAKMTKSMEIDELAYVDASEAIKEVSFGLYAAEDIPAKDDTKIPVNGLIEVKYCDADGNIEFLSDLPNGNYYVKELTTSKYYVLDKSRYDFGVTNNEHKVLDLSSDFSFENKLYRQEISFKKVAADTTQPLGGATIEITTTDDKVVYVGTTESDGTLSNLPQLTIGRYNYREVKAPDGYVLDTKSYVFEVTGNEPDGYVIDLYMENTPIKGSISVVKIGDSFTSVEELKDNNGNITYIPVYASGNLSGAEFEIVAKDDIVTGDGTTQVKKGTVVDTIVTNENGIAYSKELYVGTYIVRETKAPDGYQIADFEVEVTLTNTNTVMTTDPINNDRNITSISLTKTMLSEETGILDIKEEIKKVSFGIFADEKILADDGSYIPKDGLIEQVYCDANGDVNFSVVLPYGKYYVKEMTTSEYYILDKGKVRFEIDADSKGNINLSENNSFVNTPDTVPVEFKKVAAEDNSPLEGAEISISYGDKEIYRGVTGKNGMLSGVPELPKGIYSYRETKAPYGYDLDKTVYTFTIKGDETLVELVLKNTLSTGKIEITKTDIATDETLPNCGIRLYDEKGNIIAEKYTDAKGKVVFDNLKFGKYYYQEFDAPKGYLINEGKFSFEITEDGQIIKAVLKDKKKVDTPDTPSTPKTPSTPNVPDTPKVTTGDATRVTVFLMLCIVSAGLIFLTRKKWSED